jgi:hypothetical protein
MFKNTSRVVSGTGMMTEGQFTKLAFRFKYPSNEFKREVQLIRLQ